MARQTETESIKAAKKNHSCSWCDARIKPGEPYAKYRYFDGGDAGTVKLHMECEQISSRVAIRERGIEFYPGDNPRGCDCGFDPECGRCTAMKLSD